MQFGSAMDNFTAGEYREEYLAALYRHLDARNEPTVFGDVILRMRDTGMPPEYITFFINETFVQSLSDPRLNRYAREQAAYRTTPDYMRYEQTLNAFFRTHFSEPLPELPPQREPAMDRRGFFRAGGALLGIAVAEGIAYACTVEELTVLNVVLAAIGGAIVGEAMGVAADVVIDMNTTFARMSEEVDPFQTRPENAAGTTMKVIGRLDRTVHARVTGLTRF